MCYIMYTSRVCIDGVLTVIHIIHLLMIIASMQMGAHKTVSYIPIVVTGLYISCEPIRHQKYELAVKSSICYEVHLEHHIRRYM